MREIKRYQSQLLNDKLKMQYLYDRGLTLQAIKYFHLGLAHGHKWEEKYQFPKVRFKHRIMIPMGRGGKFTGRDTLSIDKKYHDKFDEFSIDYNEEGNFVPPKYFHSYNQTSLMMNQKNLHPNTTAILMEGHFNVISMWQGLEAFDMLDIYTPIGLGGKNLSKENIQLLKKNSPHLILLLDGDKAGVRGILHLLPMLLKEGFEVEIIIPPKGKDVNDLLVDNKGDMELFLNKTIFNKRNLSPMDFYLRYCNSFKNPFEKQKAFDSINHIDKEILLNKIINK